MNEYHTIANQMYTLDGIPRPEQTLGFTNGYALWITRVDSDLYNIKVKNLLKPEHSGWTLNNLTEEAANGVIAVCESGNEWPGEQS